MLELSNHPFHSIAFLVQCCVGVTADRAVRSRRDYRQGSNLLNRCDQLIRIIARIGQHGVGLEPFEQRLGLCTVMPFTSGHDESERIAQCIAHGMQFRGKPTPATPYRLRLLPPFAPAAC